MNPFDIIPAIDILDQRVVRLTQGNYDEVTQYPHDPIALAQQFEKAGIKRLHIVDLNGAKDGKTINFDLIQSIRKATSFTIEIGGGIRNKTAIDQYLSIGIDYIILGSIAIKDFDLTTQFIQQYPDKIIIGLDVKDQCIAIQGWTEKSAYTMKDFIEKLNPYPIQSIIYTDISKDGMMNGPDFDGLRAYASLSNVPLIASGGIRGADDIAQLKHIHNVSGAIVGKAFYSGAISLESLLHS